MLAQNLVLLGVTCLGKSKTKLSRLSIFLRLARKGYFILECWNVVTSKNKAVCMSNRASGVMVHRIHLFTIALKQSDAISTPVYLTSTA